MEIQEVRKRIVDAKAYLEDYRMYGSMVTEAIDALDRLDEMVANLREEHLAEAMRIAEELNNRLEPYRGYVPALARYMDQILEWLRSQKG